MMSLVSLIVVRSRGVITPAAAQQQHSEQWRVEEKRAADTDNYPNILCRAAHTTSTGY